MGLLAEHITFGYTQTDILNDVGLEVKPGKLLALLGPNGTGKTTLLRCIGRILQPRAGHTLVDGEDIAAMSARKRARYIGYVPQSTALIFPGTVADTVLTGRMPYVDFRLTRRDKEIAFAVIGRLGLEGMAFNNINRLSGGERQRVFIARALAQEPRVLLLDEPTSSLDLKNQLSTLQILRRLVREKQLAAVISIHDLNLAAMFCDSVLMLKESGVFSWGSPGEVITEENIKKVYGVQAAVDYKQKVPHMRLLDVEQH
ncbi:MAG: ABC transporter ATP-binding protein [Peptococcaceae bacterium]|nr:ABC transporter ATP-binding protein [Peptococcaceae bacterium]